MAVTLIFGALAAISAHAQSMQGSVAGAVTDASGAGIPNVKVPATNEWTSFTRSTQTNESGLYELPNLEPSEYMVKAEASGFKSYTNTKVRLANRESLRIHIKLDVGDVAQEVTVEGQIPVIRTEDAKIDSGMTFQYLDQRPTNSAHGFGLTAIEATRTLPGVYYSRVFGDDGTGVMITGARSNQTSVNVMGVKQVQFQTYNAALSAMEEVKIERFNTPAEYLNPATVEMTLRHPGDLPGRLLHDLPLKRDERLFQLAVPDHSLNPAGDREVLASRFVQRRLERISLAIRLVRNAASRAATPPYECPKRKPVRGVNSRPQPRPRPPSTGCPQTGRRLLGGPRRPPRANPELRRQERNIGVHRVRSPTP